MVFFFLGTSLIASIRCCNLKLELTIVDSMTRHIHAVTINIVVVVQLLSRVRCFVAEANKAPVKSDIFPKPASSGI